MRAIMSSVHPSMERRIKHVTFTLSLLFFVLAGQAWAFDVVDAVRKRDFTVLEKHSNGVDVRFERGEVGEYEPGRCVSASVYA